jgi:branched-chain amino acid transport system permease protein
MLIAILINGIVVGCIYALVAVGFTVIYNATETVNFAVGESLMLGAYCMLTFSQLWGWSYLLALLATIAASCVLGYAVLDQAISRPMVQASLLSRVIALIGLSAVIKGSVRLIWGADAYQMRSPFPTRPIALGPVLVNAEEIAVVLITVAIVGALYLFFQFTKFGTAMRATAQSRRAASLMGVNVTFVFSAAWVIGTVLSALGGVLLGPLLLVDPDMGFVSFKSFTAVVLGGFGSLPGAVIGGILLGVVENLAAGYIGAELQTAATFLLLIAVLAIRPTGLFGRTLQRRV